MATIGIWGDSIVYGAVDIDGSGWANRVRKSLSQKAENGNLEWINTYVRGICGETSQDMLRRFAVEAESVFPDIIIIAIGINDAAYRGQEMNVLVSEHEFEKNLHELISIAQKHTKKIIFVGLTRVNEALVQPYPESSTGKMYANKIITKYDSIVQKVAASENLPFVDVSDLIEDNDLDDGLHPNSFGHEKLANRILPIVEKMLGL
jgi:lysophospholipase L1-like esterase